MQVFTNPALLALADFQELALELLALLHRPLQLVVHREQLACPLDDALLHLIAGMGQLIFNPALVGGIAGNLGKAAELSRVIIDSH